MHIYIITGRSCVNFIFLTIFFLAICRFVVDTMQSVCIKASEYDMPKSSKLEDTTLIGLTFGGYLRSKVSSPTTFLLYSFLHCFGGSCNPSTYDLCQIKCMKCQVKSELREKMMDLTVEIDGDISTLDDALRRFTRTEILDGDNKYRCGRLVSISFPCVELRVVL